LSGEDDLFKTRVDDQQPHVPGRSGRRLRHPRNRRTRDRRSSGCR